VVFGVVIEGGPSTAVGLYQGYGKDPLSRNLKIFTIHSLRHPHVTNYVIDWGLPLPIVQKHVGHRSLKITSVYLSPSVEKIAEAYNAARKDDVFKGHSSYYKD